MSDFQTFIILIFIAVILVGIAQKIHISYPIALVLGGTAIGFIPGLKAISFDPNLLLTVVLPPILYYAAFSISFREFKRNWKNIFSLALGLVILTTIVIGVIFKWLFPEISWGLAFAFGAIVSPPDAVAATTILKRYEISPRLLAILEGESLINDASALVLYKLAVVAILSGTFSLSEASVDFIKISAGGIAIGMIFGILLQNFSKKYLDPIVGVIFSFTIPYATYICADYLGVSGVLAVVVNGLIGAYILAKHQSSLRRVLGWASWDTFIILFNCFVFILIGLQLKHLIAVMTPKQIALHTTYALFITLALIIIRLVWVYSTNAYAFLCALKSRSTRSLCPQILQEAAIIGWSGMRGIVSLTAALALPFAMPNGFPIQGRDEAVFMTFVVILITLILPSSTLTKLIRLLGINLPTDHRRAHQARKHLAQIAETKIQHLHASEHITEREFAFLTQYFCLQRHVFEISTSALQKMSNLERARLKIFQAQRDALLAMWERQEIDDKLFRQLEHELDVEETHIARAELK